MNKLTKLGVSALCGSLAAVSAANAGELTVTGGVDMSWVSLDNDTTGNPIGMGSNLTFKGSGELDNGWTFDLTVAMLNGDTYSNANVTLDMGGLGKLDFNQGNSANGIQAFDDKMPTAWEEPWGAGLGTGVQLVSGIGAQGNMQYTTPTVLGITLTAAVSPDMGAANPADKANAVTYDATGAGYDVTLNINPSFGTEALSSLNLFVGGHGTEHHNQTGELNDAVQATGGITFDIGPVSLGAQLSGISTGKTATSADVDWYKNAMYGIAFNVNDNLSVSYGDHKSRQGFVSPSFHQSKELDMDSWQIAYTLGGASFRYADISVNNASYQTTTSFDKDARVLSVSLAF